MSLVLSMRRKMSPQDRNLVLYTPIWSGFGQRLEFFSFAPQDEKEDRQHHPDTPSLAVGMR
jgi:hypothetical protein